MRPAIRTRRSFKVLLAALVAPLLVALALAAVSNNADVGGNVIFAASTATITAISADMGYTWAATNDGAAWCWGANDSGQLGDGTTTERDQAVLVTAI
jgi:hypothetical protein